MATLADVTKQLSETTIQNVAETQKLNKSNVTLRTNVVDLKTAVQDSAKATKRVEFLESLLDKNNVGLADTFKDTLAGPLGTLADAIPGKAFLLPFLKLAAQRTPLKGILERRRDAARDKLQTKKATTAIEQSGTTFNNEEEKQAAIERLKLEMQKKEQEVQIAEKNKQISEMLGLEIEKFDSIVGKTEEVEEKAEKAAKGGSGSAVADTGGGGGAAMVEEQRDAERASERRHRELIDALKGGAGGDAPADTGKGAKGPLRGVGGVIKSIGQGFKYLGKNLASIAKGALAMGLMGASLIPFAISAKMFNDVEWESLAKAGASLLGLAGVAFILGKASGSMIIGGAAIAVLGGALWVAGKGFQQFAELDWKTIGMGFVAILGLAAVAAVLSFALPFIIPGSIAIAALGAALIPFAYAAGMAAPALTEIAEAFNAFGDVPISTMFAIPAALAAVGAALVAMSAGNFVSGILDGIGKLFGNESPIDKIVRLAESAPNVIALGSAMRSFGDDVDAMMSGLDRLDPAKVDKLDDFSEKIENFVDSMPGVIGTAKIAAFAAAFASIAASAGIAPAVASGVEAATGEVIEVQQNPKAYVAKRQTQQTALPTQEQDIPEDIQTETGETIVTQKDSTEVPEGKVKVKYKGETVLVDKEDAEKVKAITDEMNQIAEQRESLREAHDNTLPHQRIKKRKIKDADKRLMNKQMQLEKQRKVAIASAVGEDTSGMTTVAEDKQSVVDAMAGGRSNQLNNAQSENTELAGASKGTTNIVAPTTNNITNNQSGGGSGGGSIVPIPISEPDQKTKAMIANNF